MRVLKGRKRCWCRQCLVIDLEFFWDDVTGFLRLQDTRGYGYRRKMRLERERAEAVERARCTCTMSTEPDCPVHGEGW